MQRLSGVGMRHSYSCTTARFCRAASVAKRGYSVSKDVPIGLIGLGHMGSKLFQNFTKDGYKVLINDKEQSKATALSSDAYRSLDQLVSECDVVLSILPNDTIVNSVSTALLAARSNSNRKGPLTHISCSTVSPKLSRELFAAYVSFGSSFVSSPVFARPDGLASRQATWMISGDAKGKEIATTILSTVGNVVDMGEDAGSSNVVKLCGNFMIAASIETIAEAMVLAEKNGVDRTKVMDLLSSTIFNCLIYKGYGQRVAQRDHRPGGFSLELGLKDVTLVSEAAKAVDAPMPFLSTLSDRYMSAKANGREKFDWSAIGLTVAENAGIDVSADVKRNVKDIEEGNYY